MDESEEAVPTSVGGSFVLLAVAVGTWVLGGAWWAGHWLGPLHWLGAVLEVVGLFATIGAIGMVWRSLRNERTHRGYRP
jgi:hypothetical protein